MFKVEYLPIFEKEAKKLLTLKELKYLELYIEKNLILNGDRIGKVLTYDFLREIKIGNKRIYYLIYKNLALILLVAISKNKKDQQIVIDYIKENIESYKLYAYNKYREFNL